MPYAQPVPATTFYRVARTLMPLGPQTPIIMKKCVCLFRARGYLEGRHADVLRLGHDEAESSGAEGNQGSDGTSLAAQAHGGVVIVIVVGTGGSLIHSAADTRSNAASLGGDPGLSGVDGGADVRSLVLGPRLGLGSVLLTPALDVGSLVLSP